MSYGPLNLLSSGEDRTLLCVKDLFHNVIILMVLMIPLMCISKSYQY